MGGGVRNKIIISLKVTMVNSQLKKFMNHNKIISKNKFLKINHGEVPINKKS